MNEKSINWCQTNIELLKHVQQNSTRANIKAKRLCENHNQSMNETYNN